MSASIGTTLDRIEKRVVLRATRARVWRAIANAEEFGSWFGVDFTGARFTPGATLRGRVACPGYEHLVMEIVVDRMEPERLFSYRWHPDAVDPKVDYSAEPMTLVVFELQDAPEGTLLTITESGFDQIPLHRRADAFRGNEAGWTDQTRNIDEHVTRNP